MPPEAEQGQLWDMGSGLVARMRRTTDRTLTELRKADRVLPEHVGLVAVLRTVADLMDAEVRKAEPNAWTLARLATEWRATHAELRGEADTWDAQLAQFFAEPEAPSP